MPIGLMYCFEVGFFFTLTIIMGSISSHLLAANQITMQYTFNFMNVIFYIAQAITVRMGHLLGRRDIGSAKQACFAGVFISGILMIALSICYWYFPQWLISVDIDVNDPNNLTLLADIKTLFVAAAFFQVFEAIRISLFGALRALKDTTFTLLISIISFWCIALPIGYLLADSFHLGGQGLWYGMTIGAAISVFLLSWRFNSKIECYEPH
jgi:MATE family multidrug resistance protein